MNREKRELELMRGFIKGEINATELIKMIIQLEKTNQVLSEQRQKWIDKFNDLKNPSKGCKHKWSWSYDIDYETSEKIHFDVCTKCGEEKR